MSMSTNPTLSDPNTIAAEALASPAASHLPGPKEWQADSSYVDRAELYTSGPTRLIECLDGEKPVLAVLLSSDLGFWLQKLVNLQKKIYEAGNALTEQSPGLERRKQKAEKTLVQAMERISGLGLAFSRKDILQKPYENGVRFWTKRADWARSETERVEQTFADLQDQTSGLEKERTDLSVTLCCEYREMYIRAGVLAYYGPKEDTTPTTEHKSPPEPSSSQQQNDDDHLSVPTTIDEVDAELVTIKLAGASSINPKEEERQKRYRIFSETERALDAARNAHDMHRGGYRKSLLEYIAQQGDRKGDLETEFGPIWFHRGSQLAHKLKDAEKSMHVAVAQARQVGFFVNFPELDFGDTADDISNEDWGCHDMMAEQKKCDTKCEKWCEVDPVPHSPAGNSIPPSYVDEPAAPVPEDLIALIDTTTSNPSQKREQPCFDQGGPRDALCKRSLTNYSFSLAISSAVVSADGMGTGAKETDQKAPKEELSDPNEIVKNSRTPGAKDNTQTSQICQRSMFSADIPNERELGKEERSINAPAHQPYDQIISLKRKRTLSNVKIPDEREPKKLQNGLETTTHLPRDQSNTPKTTDSPYAELLALTKNKCLNEEEHDDDKQEPEVPRERPGGTEARN